MFVHTSDEYDALSELIEMEQLNDYFTNNEKEISPPTAPDAVKVLPTITGTQAL